MTVPTKGSLKTGAFDKVIALGKEEEFPLRINMPTFCGRLADLRELLSGNELSHIYDLYENGVIGTDSLGWYTHNCCPSTHSAFYIAPDGQFTPCPFLHFSFGNIKEEDLQDIYENVRATGYHKLRFAKHICPPAEDHELISNVLTPLYKHKLPAKVEELPELEKFIMERTCGAS
jgi:MoaA/NifB/PqqE/SkfB family radical SAM enzyme